MFKKVLENNRLMLVTVLTFMSNDCLSFEVDRYPVIIGVSGSKVNSRSIAELDLMLPTVQSQTGISILNVKLKKDTQGSIEGNLGLVYRHNFSDKAILGIYSYFDRRKTQSKLTANQLTMGVELLSPYIDGRFNYYIPNDKKKIITPENKTFVRNHTSVYVVQKGSIVEHTLPGYDLEVGAPLFTFSPTLDEKFGTKIYMAKYKFCRKSILQNSGIRFRVEQKIKDSLFDRKGSEITLHFGSSFTNQEKWDSFVGLSVKWALSKGYSNPKMSKMQKRMMDTVIRDVDIITKTSKAAPKILPVYWEGQEIRNIYFVGEKDDEQYQGDGSYELPFSKKQLTKLMSEKKFQKKSTDLILPIMFEESITEFQYIDLLNQCSAVDIRQYDTINLETADKSLFSIEQNPQHFPEFENRKVNDMSSSYIQYKDLSELQENIDSWMNSISENEQEIANDSILLALEESITSNTAHNSRTVINGTSITRRAENILEEIRNSRGSPSTGGLEGNRRLRPLDSRLRNTPITQRAENILEEIRNNRGNPSTGGLEGNRRLRPLDPRLRNTPIIQRTENAAAKIIRKKIENADSHDKNGLNPVRRRLNF